MTNEKVYIKWKKSIIYRLIKWVVRNSVVSVENVTLDANSKDLKIGTAAQEGEKTIQLKATITPDDATNQKLTWKSDNEDVATVDNTGKVTAVAAGKAIITVTTEDGSKTASCTVTVTKSDLDTDSTLKTFTIGGQDVSGAENIITTGAEKTFEDFSDGKVKGIVVEKNSDKAKSVIVKVGNDVVKESDLASKVLAENDVITVEVTAEDDTKTTYKVTVKK